MGLLTEWRDLLKALFPWCFKSSLDENEKITTKIEDMSLKFYQIFTGVKTWEEAKLRLGRRIISGFEMFDSMKRSVVCFDDKFFVPKSKAPTQKTRRYSTPLTPEEEKKFIIGVTSLGMVNEKGEEILSRAWATKSLQPKLISYFTHCLTTLVPGTIPPKVGEIRDIRERKSIWIDGARIDHLKNDNELDHIFDKGVLENEHYKTFNGYDYCKVNTPSFQVHMECPTFNEINIMREKKKQSFKNIVHVHPSCEVGEADLQIVYNVSKFIHDGDVLVSSHDGDELAILLMNMKDWINLETGNPHHKIYLDFSMSSSASAYVDVYQLWRAIIIYFKEKFPTVLNPIEVFVSMMILTGSDFVLKSPFITQAKMWEAWCMYGHKILYPGLSDRPSSIHLIDPKYSELEIDEFGTNSDDMIIEKNLGRENVAMLISNGCGIPDTRYSIKMFEERYIAFIAFVYAHVFFKNHSAKEIERMNYEQLKKHADIHDSKLGDKSKGAYRMRNIHEMYAEIRRLWWNLDYWMNGGKRKRIFRNEVVLLFIDPIAVDEKGVSRCGWELDNFGEVVRSIKVTQ